MYKIMIKEKKMMPIKKIMNYGELKILFLNKSNIKLTTDGDKILSKELENATFSYDYGNMYIHYSEDIIREVTNAEIVAYEYLNILKLLKCETSIDCDSCLFMGKCISYKSLIEKANGILHNKEIIIVNDNILRCNHIKRYKFMFKM